MIAILVALLVCNQGQEPQAAWPPLNGAMQAAATVGGLSILRGSHILFLLTEDRKFLLANSGRHRYIDLRTGRVGPGFLLDAGVKPGGKHILGMHENMWVRWLKTQPRIALGDRLSGTAVSALDSRYITGSYGDIDPLRHLPWTITLVDLESRDPKTSRVLLEQPSPALWNFLAHEPMGGASGAGTLFMEERSKNDSLDGVVRAIRVPHKGKAPLPKSTIIGRYVLPKGVEPYFGRSALGHNPPSLAFSYRPVPSSFATYDSVALPDLNTGKIRSLGVPTTSEEGPGRLDQLAYIRGDLYAFSKHVKSGDLVYRLLRYDQKGSKWRSVGPYRYIARTGSQAAYALQDTRSGQVWVIEAR